MARHFRQSRAADEIAASFAHAPTKAGIVDKGLEGGEPTLGGVGEEAIASVVDDIAVGADGRSDDGEANGHVLQELERALATGEGRVFQRHDTYVEVGEEVEFVGEIPLEVANIGEIPVERLVEADDDEFEIALLCQGGEDGLQEIDVVAIEGRANPANADGIGGGGSDGGVAVSFNDSGNDLDGGAVLAVEVSEVGIAADDGGIARGHAPELAVVAEQARKPARAFLVGDVEGVVHVEDDARAKAYEQAFEQWWTEG